MRCPNCSFEQSNISDVCPVCGVVFEKIEMGAGSVASLESASASAVQVSEETVIDLLAPVAISRDTWTHAGVGVVLACLAFVFPLSRVALDGFIILIHEMGHAAFGWLFGRLSIPAFDLNHGGGVTMIQDQSVTLLFGIYLGFGTLFWLARGNRRDLIAIGIILPIYSLCAHTNLNELIILYMGHGTELVIATIFLYRAASGRSIINPLERPVYSLVGWFVLMRDVSFAFSLIFDYGARARYYLGKGGHANDFVRIAENHLNCELGAVAFFFLLCCFLPLIIAFLLHRYQPRIEHLMDTVLCCD